MNRTVFASQALRGSALRTVKPLLIAALGAWAAGCAVEDPVAKLRGMDSGSGSFSSDDDEALLEANGWWWAPEEVPPDCAPDAGAACEDAGTPGVP